MKTNVSKLETIHSFWIAGPLRPVNLLTIRSFLAAGHPFMLYTYDISLLTAAPEGIIVRDAREIMPESEIYYYKNMMGGKESFKFGGIAERLKAEMLYQLGGWHVDLDVTCLKPFDFQSEYVFRPHAQGVVANMIKAPKHSELARQYLAHTKTIDANNQDWTKSFRGLIKIITSLGLAQFILEPSLLGTDDAPYWQIFREPGFAPGQLQKAIHWCCAMEAPYAPNSFYHSLLQKYKL